VLGSSGIRASTWASCCACWMLSISSLFYIIVGQLMFSRLMQPGARCRGWAGGLDEVKFLMMTIGLDAVAAAAARPGCIARLFLEEIGKEYVRTARMTTPPPFLPYPRIFSNPQLVRPPRLPPNHPSPLSCSNPQILLSDVYSSCSPHIINYHPPINPSNPYHVPPLPAPRLTHLIPPHLLPPSLSDLSPIPPPPPFTCHSPPPQPPTHIHNPLDTLTSRLNFSPPYLP